MYVCMYVCIETLRARFGSARFVSRFGSVRFKTRSHRIAPRSGCMHDDDDDRYDDDSDDGDDDGDSDDDDDDGYDDGDVDDAPTIPILFLLSYRIQRGLLLRPNDLQNLPQKRPKSLPRLMVFTTLVNTWALAAPMIVMVFTTLVNTWVNV